jgi:hypothetical protein
MRNSSITAVLDLVIGNLLQFDGGGLDTQRQARRFWSTNVPKT